VSKVGSWDKLNQWKGVKAHQVPDEALATPCAVVSTMVNQRVAVHAPIANYLETFAVRKWLRATFEIG
jgi:hypothetical protein